MTSGKGVDDLINTLINKKFEKKGFLTMAKISSWHFRPLLYVVWLKKACKREGHGYPRTPLATLMVLHLANHDVAQCCFSFAPLGFCSLSLLCTLL